MATAESATTAGHSVPRGGKTFLSCWVSLWADVFKKSMVGPIATLLVNDFSLIYL